LTVEGQVEPTRIIASGRSEYFPVIAGESVDARAANRRTEIILTPKLEELFQIIGN
jgi:chemotaxis protein MotB